MRFSIVVVSLNPGEGLKNTLDSINTQSFRDFEVIVEDGGSTDGSLDVLKNYPNMRIQLFTESDSGIYDAMNRAANRALGQYIYFLNCGDYFYSSEVLNKVSQAIDAASQSFANHRIIVYGNIYERRTSQKVMSNPVIDGFACFRNVPCHQACFYDKKLVEEHPFDISYKVRADYEQFLWCYYKASASMQFLDEVIADYEGGGYSETPSGLRISKEEHKKITAIYMSSKDLIKYKTIMILTLSRLRSSLASNPKTAVFYDKIKNRLYSKRK